MKILIVGGVAGGATVAARLRRLDEQAEVILFERGAYVSYANCGLPYYIGGTIAQRSKLFVQTVKGFTDRFRIDIRTEQEVTAIDRVRKQVTVRRVATGETYIETYDRLVLSPGAEPLRPPIEGIDSPRIFTLRSVPDTDAIKQYVDEQRPRRAVVVGRSLVVGKPAAMMLDRENATVTLCNSRTQALPALCKEADIVVVAMGRQGFIGSDCLREGQVVVDVGIHVNAEGKLCGDVRFDEAEPLVEAITPVPGGVGTVTTSVLVGHVVDAAEKTL